MISVLVPKSSWFEPYAQEIADKMGGTVYHGHEDIPESDIVFILSYTRLVPKEFLDRNKHNIVVHGSDLPKGRGWAPVFWQVIEGKNEIVMTCFEANAKCDDGPYYFKDKLVLDGTELNAGIRKKMGEKIVEMCLKYSPDMEPRPQEGEPSFYEKRTPGDSELDPQKSIAEQFNLLRTVHNDDYPAYFMMHGKKYILRIYDEDNDRG